MFYRDGFEIEDSALEACIDYFVIGTNYYGGILSFKFKIDFAYPVSHKLILGNLESVAGGLAWPFAAP